MNVQENNEVDDQPPVEAEAPAGPDRSAVILRLARGAMFMALRAAGELAMIVGRAAFRLSMIILRAIGKFSITTWRLASALDSALWRAVKLLARRLGEALLHALALLGQVLRSLILWLPTRTGRAYSALCGVAIVICALWIADLLRESDEVIHIAGGASRPPIDEEDPILARIGARFVHLSEIEAATRASGMLEAGETLTLAQAFERGLVESYVEQRLLARAAEAGGLHRAPAVLRRVNTARDRILAASLIQSRLDEEVSPDVVERYYNEQRKIMTVGDEVRARHILVDTEETALEIVTLLDGGAEFASLARERSADRATAPVGGEIGWFSRSLMARNFSNVAFRTPVGEIAPPFRTEFGWHVLEVTGRRPTRAKPLSEVEGEIEEFLRNETIARLLSELVDENRVVYYRPEVARETTPPPPLAPSEQRPRLRDIGRNADG